MTRHTWVVTWPAPFYNAEDDSWFDSRGRIETIYDVVGRAFGEAKAREMDALVDRWAFLEVDDTVLPASRAIFPDRDQQAHMGVEFD